MKELKHHSLTGVAMIIEVEGDINLSSANAIAHVVAPNDEFKSGFAYSLRESWPALYKDFRHFCRQPVGHQHWRWIPGGSAMEDPSRSIDINLFARPSRTPSARVRVGPGIGSGVGASNSASHCRDCIGARILPSGCTPAACRPVTASPPSMSVVSCQVGVDC